MNTKLIDPQTFEKGERTSVIGDFYSCHFLGARELIQFLANESSGSLIGDSFLPATKQAEVENANKRHQMEASGADIKCVAMSLIS